MDWIQWASFGGAATGTGLGVFNALQAFRRDHPRVRLRERLDPANPVQQSRARYTIRLENTGRITIAVEEVTLQIGAGDLAQTLELWSRRYHPDGGMVIEPGRAVAFALPPEALYVSPMGKLVTAIARTEDGRRIQRRCVMLGKFYNDLQAAAVDEGEGGA